MKGLLGLIARLPEGLAYGLANTVFVVLYYGLRYRRAVVAENLRHAFPQLDSAERVRIEKASYRHFCNLFVEIIRSTRMTLDEFRDRVSFRNADVLAEATEGYTRQAIILLIHQGNWEWLLHGAMAQLPVPADPVYKPLHSGFWEEFMLQARSRFGAVPMAIDNVGREVIRGRKRQRLVVMLADQAGPRHGGYWTDFLHRPASFYRGADKLAQALKLPVLFAQCHCPRRGHYEVEFHPISIPPHDPDGEVILHRYVRRAEECIADDPRSYLWTNRRWKKKPPDATAVGDESVHNTDA